MVVFEWISGGLGCFGGKRRPVPWKQFADPARRVFGDAGQDVGEPGVFFDAVEPAGHEQAVHHRRTLAAAIGSEEELARIMQRW